MMNQLITEAAPGVQASDVTQALHAILTTDKFAASPQMSAFLRYVVEQTLLGNTRRIKAFTVGIEALGKPASFDPQTDPSVRVLAKRLRSSLDTYYQQHRDTLVYIELKPGSYVPKFLLRSEIQHDAHDSASGGLEGFENMHMTCNMSYVSVKPQEPRPQSATGVVMTGEQRNGSERKETVDTLAAPQSGISQFWQAYRSASKVA
jgi:hypothetical protein